MKRLASLILFFLLFFTLISTSILIFNVFITQGHPTDYSDLIISEFFYDSVGTDTGCFIEIYNCGSTTVDLNDASHDIIIEGINGANGESYVRIDLTGSISADSYYVLAQDITVANSDQIDVAANFQNGPDGVRLVDNTTSTFLDGLEYGDTGGISTGCLEGSPTIDVLSGYSLTRDEFNSDSNNNSLDFYPTLTVTPGEAGVIMIEFGLVISEVFYDSLGTDAGCFIEIYNSGSAAFDLDDVGHDIIIEGVNGATGESYVIIDLNGSVASGSYYVLAQDSTVANYDQINPGVDFQNGPDGIRLLDNSTKIKIDSIQYGDTGGISTGCLEGNPTIDVLSGYSLTRDELNTDTDNNSLDFYSTSTLTPGTVGIYPDASLLKISEVLYDTLGLDTGCFIEIYYSGSVEINLDDEGHDIIIEGVNGATGESYVIIDLNGSVAAGSYYVLAQDSTVANYDQIDAGADFQNGPDGIRLYDNTTKTIIDGIQYGDTGGFSTGCLEGTPASDVESGYSLTRDTYNTDTNNNSIDFSASDAPTPGTSPTEPTTTTTTTTEPTTEITTETSSESTSTSNVETSQQTPGIELFIGLLTISSISIMYRRKRRKKIL